MIYVHATTQFSSIDGHAITPIAMTDSECETAYADLLERQQNSPTYDQEWVVSSENFFTRIRVGIVEHDLNCEDVTFTSNGTILRPNRYGALLEWPRGFLDYGVELLERLMDGAHEIRRQEQPPTPVFKKQPRKWQDGVYILKRRKNGKRVIARRYSHDGRIYWPWEFIGTMRVSNDREIVKTFTVISFLGSQYK